MVYAVQGEKNSRKIRFNLFDNGVKWKIDQSAIVLISYKKPDGNGGMYDVLDNGNPAFEFPSESTNSVIITLAEQVLTTIGRVPLLVSFMVEDEILSTFNIILDVSENPGIDVAESEDYFSLSAAIDAAKKVVGEMLDPNAFASKAYVDSSIGDLRDDLDEIADDARVFYVTISKSDDGSFVADKSVEVIHAAYDNGRTVKAVVDDDGEQVIIPLIGIIEDDTVMYVGYGANSNRIVISQTDILVSVHNDALPNVKTVNGTAPDENGNVVLEIQSGGSSNVFHFTVEATEAVKSFTIELPTTFENIFMFNVHVTFGTIEQTFKLVGIYGGSYVLIGDIKTENLVAGESYGVNIYCLKFYEQFFTHGVGMHGYTYQALPSFSGRMTVDRPNSNIMSYYSNTADVLIPAGTTFEIWGLCK